MSDQAVATERRNGSGLNTLLAVWGRRKWLAMLAFAAPMSAGLSLIVFLPNIYRSTATVLVDRQQIPETFVQSTVTSALETRLHTISQEVLSRARLEALIDRFGLYRDLRRRVSFEDVIERTRRDIKLDLKSVEARGQREAMVAFTISYQGSDPDTVSRVANALASFYVEENLRARERQATGTAEFLKVQLAETKKRLDEQEHKVSDFNRRYLGELPQQMDANLATLERLHAQLRVNADNQTRAVERRLALSSQLAEIETLLVPPSIATGAPVTVVPGAPPGPESPEVRLARAKQELTKLRTQFSEKYPDVARLAAEVSALEREIAEASTRDRERTTGTREVKAEEKPALPQAAPLTPYVLRVREALSEAEADIKVYKGEEKRLRDGIATYQARVEQVPRREQEFKELSRDYESTRALYQSLLKRFEEAQLAESMEQRQKGEQFRLLDPAIPNPQPAAPARVKLLVMTLIGSLGLAAAAVMAAERIDTSFHTVEELRVFNAAVPVLASIPWIMTRTNLRRRRWRLRLAICAGLVGLIVLGGITYFLAHGNERLVAFLGRGGS